MKHKNANQIDKRVQLKKNNVLQEFNPAAKNSDTLLAETAGIIVKKTGTHHLLRNEVPLEISEPIFKDEDLTDTELLNVLLKVKNGDFSTRLPLDHPGTKGSICRVLNEIINQNERKVSDISKFSTDIGKEEILRRANEELKGEAVRLNAQKSETDLKNREVEEARKSLEEKANQLAQISKYKSEFLANMSHELRTPLNSLQILAHELIKNYDGNLTAKQIQYAKIIKACGEELIDLINDILDLSKIEAGYLSIVYSPVSFREITNYIENTFRHISEAKQLNFTIETEDSLPEFIETDSQRLNQILKNLLSNAFKFTEKGHVLLKIYKANHNWNIDNSDLNNSETIIAFEISDTGIGISEEKQNIIFEAFQQAEGSTSRKYGGTGLGLSISRGLSTLLGGVIELESIQEQGSKFTLFLPLKVNANVEKKQIELKSKIILSGKVKSSKPSKPSTFSPTEINEYFVDRVGDDRLNILPNDKTLLIIDEDVTFAKMIIEKAHVNGMKAIAATKKEEVIDYVIEFKPQCIIMNIKSTNNDYWKIMNRIKNDLTMRHIPIYVTSSKENKDTAFMNGARNFLLKPFDEKQMENLFIDINNFVNKKTKSLLIVNENEKELAVTVKAVEYTDVKITTAKTAKEAIDLIRKNNFDCIILDPVLINVNGFDILKELEKKASVYQTSLIIYTEKAFEYQTSLFKNSEKALHPKEKIMSNQFPNILILKTKHSLGQLINQTSLFLYRVYNELPEKMRNTINEVYLNDDTLLGKNVLIVDDDIRNLFVLTNALERYVHTVSNAESGQEAISILEKNKDIDIVLMDIMMPEMDGYETMRSIRKIKKNTVLPIIALTANAMKGDRQKCIKSGASDYITKPVNMEQLLDLMRVWLK